MRLHAGYMRCYISYARGVISLRAVLYLYARGVYSLRCLRLTRTVTPLRFYGLRAQTNTFHTAYVFYGLCGTKRPDSITARYRKPLCKEYTPFHTVFTVLCFTPFYISRTVLSFYSEK